MNTVESLPFSLGIRTNYKGYYYLVDALTLIMEDENRLLSIGTELFPAIALKYQTDVRCIERNIRHSYQSLLGIHRLSKTAKHIALSFGIPAHSGRISGYPFLASG